MNQKVGITVSASADTSQVEKAINALGQRIAQANRVQYSPVSPKSIDDVKRLNGALAEVLKTQAGLRQRLKATGQESTPFTDWDWSRMYPHSASRGVAMQGTFERVVGAGRFSASQQAGPATQPTQPQAPSGQGAGGGGGVAMQVAQAGLRAAGPVGGVAAGAIGTGASAGFGAGLMGLVGGIAALGVGKLVGAIAEKVGQAEDNNVDYDRLKRILGDVGVSFDTLKGVVQGSAKQMSITFAEAGRLGTQFAKLSNISGDQYKTISDELETGVGLSRSFGLEPSQGVGLMGQMRGMGITSNTQESRRFALLLGETIGKSGAFAKAEEVFEAIGGYATSQTRNSMGAANVAGFAGMYSSMVGSGIPGMDPAGAAGLLNRINSALAGGGAKGEASQFFTGIVGHRMGLDPIQTQILREGGAFATNSEAFGEGSAAARYGLAGPSGDKTFLQGSLDELRRQYGGNKGLLAQATANHLGIGMRQSMALLSLEPNQMGEMQNYAGDLTKMSGKGIGNLSKALYGSSSERQALRSDFLGRTGANAISADDRKALEGAKSDDELKKALASIAAKYDQESTTGSDIRDSKNALDNIKTSLADKLVPINQAMRDGILFLAGGGKKSRLEVMKEIEDLESKSRVKGIDTEYTSKLKAAGGERADATKAVRDLVEKNRKAVMSGEMTPEEHQRQMAPLLKRQADAIAADAKAREWHTEALEKERKLREKNIEELEKADAKERVVGAVPAAFVPSDDPNQSNAESARLGMRGGAPGRNPQSGGSNGGRKGYDPLSNSRTESGTQEAMKDFMDRGWTKEQSAGIVSNLISESGLRGDAVGDGGKAYGIAQWHPDRQADFERWSGKSIRDATVAEQRAFVHYELTQGKERRAGKMLKGATSASDAGSIVSEHYERPRDKVKEAAKRAALAETIARKTSEGTPAGNLGAPAAGGQGGGLSPASYNITADDITVRIVDDKTGKPMGPPMNIPTKVGPASPYGALNTGGVTGQWW